MKINANDYRSNEIIKMIREYKGKTQTEFGKDFKLTRSAIQNYEYGYRNYNLEFLQKVCKKYDLVITITSK